MNRDKSPKYLGQDEAYYMLNAERSIGGGVKSASGKTTPLPANELLCTTEVEGSPIFCGAFRSELTNEVYAFYLVEDGLNYILRVNEDKTCEIVCEFSQECFFLSAEPEHAITNWRCYLKYDKFCAHQGGKQLIAVNGIGTAMMVDVEAAIATNSFTTEFFDLCPEGCAPFQMCVPEICGALQGEFVPLESDQIDLNNHLIDFGVQLMFRHVYYDQRASEWSDISTLFFQDAKGCFDTEEGLPRCLKLRVPIGNPLVDKIQIAFRGNGESTNNIALWRLADTIEKYQPYTSEDQKWYERELADLDNFSEEDCSFDYYFCNDKDCTPIDTAQTSRVFNPIPRDAQGLIRIKDSIAFYNYVKGNCPLLESETRKFKLSLECAEDNCIPEYVDVEFYLIVQQYYNNANQPIYRMGGDDFDEPDDPTDRAYFGGIMSDFTLVYDGAQPNSRYEQYFKDKTRNFIAYIEGTDYWIEMEQWKADAGFINSEKAGVLSGFSKKEVYAFFDAERNNGSFYYQKGVFKVPRGTKGFIRIANQKSTTGLDNAQDTSTTVIGTIPTLTAYQGRIEITADEGEELYFDTCSGGVVIESPFVVNDHDIENTEGNHSSSAYGGYVTDENNRPVEGAQIYKGSVLKSTTDHNGYWHFFDYGGFDEPIEITIRVEQSPAGPFVTVKTETIYAGYQYTEKSVKIDTVGYDSNYYEDVSVLVRDCDNNPIGGIRVAISGSKYAVSDGVTGIAHFKLRNYASRDREIRAVIMNFNGCFTLDCDGNCNPCMPDSGVVALSSSFSGVPYINIPLTTNINRESALINKKGLKAGGRYPVGIVLSGSCGRLSAVYPITVMQGSIPLDDSYLDVPKTQEKGELSFCGLGYDATGMAFPDWADCLKFVRGANNNTYELQWVVDKIERVADGKIKLTIQSLNDYNATYNFESNTIYQFVEGDRIEFISNGDGAIFDTATYGLLNYQILSPFHDKVISGVEESPAEYFNQILITDDGNLDGLTEGAKVELQRPKECTDENTAFFAVLSLPIIEVSGVKVLADPTGTFQTFDTYIVNRQIGKFFIQQFEHRNPSDFWGDRLNGISDAGKAYFRNKFENERRFGRNISINNVGQFNRFGDLEKTLDAPEHGDLTSMVVYDGKIGIGIGEFDNFRFSLSDDFLRIGEDGIVRAAPPDSLISDAEPKPVGQFGCQYEDIGSIVYGDGWILWADVSKGALVKHNIDYAKDMAESQFSTYFIEKFGIIRAFNGTSLLPQEKYRFVTGFNYYTKAVQFTIKQLTGESINNEKDALLANNETILIEPRTEEVLTFASYIQDGYSNLITNDDEGCAFISFVGNNVWLHPIKTNIYNRFNGVPCDRVVTFAINQNPDIIKRAVGVEIQSELMYFVSKVLVDRTSFESEIPPIRMQKQEDKWVSSFLSDKNAKGGLFAQDSIATKPRGYFILVTIVRDNTDALKYNTINDAKRVVYDELDMILTKYFYSASSGMVEGL